MKSKLIHVLDDNMISSLKEMMISKDKKDREMAIKILQNRDTSNEESEIKINQFLMGIGLNPQVTTNAPTMWAAVYKNKPLMIDGKSYWSDRGDCTRALIDFCANSILCTGDSNNYGRPFIKPIEVRDILVKMKIFEIKQIQL